MFWVDLLLLLAFGLAPFTNNMVERRREAAPCSCVVGRIQTLTSGESSGPTKKRLVLRRQSSCREHNVGALCLLGPLLLLLFLFFIRVGASTGGLSLSFGLQAKERERGRNKIFCVTRWRDDEDETNTSEQRSRLIQTRLKKPRLCTEVKCCSSFWMLLSLLYCYYCLSIVILWISLLSMYLVVLMAHFCLQKPSFLLLQCCQQ